MTKQNKEQQRWNVGFNRKPKSLIPKGDTSSLGITGKVKRLFGWD